MIIGGRGVVHTPVRAATGRMHDASTALWPSYRENYMALRSPTVVRVLDTMGPVGQEAQ